MQKIIAFIACVVLASGCSSSPPKPPQPSGDWTPVNQPTTTEKG